MAVTLIPFGLSQESNELVDVSEVDRGLACHCVCPSCSQNLQAIKGEDRAWHFRHASRHTFENTTNQCDYNFYHSVRMMARQLIESDMSICLPSYSDSVSAEQLASVGYLVESFKVTPANSITLEGIELEGRFQNVVVDIKGTVKGVDFCIYLTHPDRLAPIELLDKNCPSFGAIAIDLTRIHEQFTTNTMKHGDSLKALLKQHIESNLEAKTWLNHPRFNKAREHALRKLDYRIKKQQYDNDKAAQQSQTGLEGFTPRSCQGKVRHCNSCNFSWPLIEGYICPKCSKPGRLN